MSKLTKRANCKGRTNGRIDPNYRKALLVKISHMLKFNNLSFSMFLQFMVKKQSLMLFDTVRLGYCVMGSPAGLGQ